MDTKTSHDNQHDLFRHSYHDRHELRKLRSFKFPKHPSSSAIAADFNIPRYTSLKDLTDAEATCNNIHIRNRLVKSTASTSYLQSSGAIMLADRSRTFFASFWEKLYRNKAALCSCWRVYVRDPIRACFRPIVMFFLRIVGWDWWRRSRWLWCGDSKDFGADLNKISCVLWCFN